MLNETLEILYMVRDKKVTPEEGEKLLHALRNSGNSNKVYNNNAEFIKIKVTDSKDKDKVNVTIPITLLSTGMKLAEKFSPEFKETGLSKADLDDILVAVKTGKTGKVVDIETDKGEKVEVIIK